MRMLHVKGWGWLEAADGKNLSQTRPAKSESEAYCKSESARSIAHYCYNLNKICYTILRFGVEILMVDHHIICFHYALLPFFSC